MSKSLSEVIVEQMEPDGKYGATAKLTNNGDLEICFGYGYGHANVQWNNESPKITIPLELVDLLTAPPATVKICDERHGDVMFYVEDDGVSCYEIGWGHGGGPPEPGKRSQYKTLEEFSSRGWGLYHESDLHDGYGSLDELMRCLGPRVYLTIDEYRIGRSVPIEDVIDAARAWAKLPPLKDTPQAEIDGTLDEEDERPVDGTRLAILLGFASSDD